MEQLVKNLPAGVRDAGLIPELGKSPGVGDGNLFQYSCQENSMDIGACWATIQGAAKSWTLVSD